jgi:hypothetical protein
LTLEQIVELGWAYNRRSYGLELRKGKTSVVVTAWPIDVYGKVPDSTSKALGDDGRESGKIKPAQQQAKDYYGEYAHTADSML